MVGFKYKMSNIQAAIGCAQIQRIEELINKKRAILESYKAAFENFDIPFWGFNSEPNDCSIGAWMTTAILDEPSENSNISEILQLNLKSKGIDVRSFFVPLSSTPPFKHLVVERVVNNWAYRIPPAAINLPCSHDIKEIDISHVSNSIKIALASKDAE